MSSHSSKRLGSVIVAGILALNTLLVMPQAASAEPRTLVRGDRGPAVLELQYRLRSASYDPGPIDGIFGTRTDTAVRGFQAARSLAVTGVADAVRHRS